MNEQKIKQLAEQAGLNDAYMNFDHKYFAQLIVAECMKVSNRSLSKYELPSDKIAEHFGVTE